MTTWLVLGAAVLLMAAAWLVLVWWGQERIVFQPPRTSSAHPSGIRRIEYGADDGQQLFAYIVEPDTETASGRFQAATGARARGTAGLHGPSRAPPGAALSPEQAIPDSRGATSTQPPFAGDSRFPIPDSLRHEMNDVREDRPGVLIAFHGNADLAQWLIPWAREVASRTGWAVMLPEYRGYAGLPGTPTYAGSRLDAHAAHRCAIDVLGVHPARIAIFGHSLGSAIATELAHSMCAPAPVALILQSPFTSAQDMARRIVPRPLSLAVPFISRVHFDTATKVASLEAPVAVAHGERDLIVPSHMGKRVHESARTKGTLLVIEHAGHNDVVEAAGEAYWEWLRKALEGR